MNRYDVLIARLAMLEASTDQARSSLRLWRSIFYSVGISAVVAATLSGASTLADFWGLTAAGVLALVAAVLTAVEKFLTAGDRVNALSRRYQDLVTVRDETKAACADAMERENVAGGQPPSTSIAEYEKWLSAKSSEIDGELKKINEMHNLV